MATDEQLEQALADVNAARTRTAEALAIIGEVRALLRPRGYVTGNRLCEIVRDYLDKEMVARGFEAGATVTPADSHIMLAAPTATAEALTELDVDAPWYPGPGIIHDRSLDA